MSKIKDGAAIRKDRIDTLLTIIEKNPARAPGGSQTFLKVFIRHSNNACKTVPAPEGTHTLLQGRRHSPKPAYV